MLCFADSDLTSVFNLLIVVRSSIRRVFLVSVLLVGCGMLGVSLASVARVETGAVLPGFCW